MRFFTKNLLFGHLLMVHAKGSSLPLGIRNLFSIWYDVQMQKDNNFTIHKIEKLPGSEVEIEGEINKDEMARCRKDVLVRLQRETSLPGFRKGHVDEKVILSKFGEMSILEEAAEIALKEAYPNMVMNNSIAIVGRPEINITKLAPENPLGFKIRVPVFPEFDLPDYKKIAEALASKKEILEVTDKEIDDVTEELKKSQARADDKDKGEKQTDENFFKKFGDFKSLDEFKNKIRENLLKEKESKAREKKRMEISKAILEKTNMEIPRTLVDGELRKMFLELEENLKRMGITTEDYLKRIEKSRDDLYKEWEETAKQRAQLQIVLNKISEKENLKASEDEIKAEADHMMSHIKNADREKVEQYVENILTTEKVFQFLETT